LGLKTNHLATLQLTRIWAADAGGLVSTRKTGYKPVLAMMA
jgi:hypothetical protein